METFLAVKTLPTEIFGAKQGIYCSRVRFRGTELLATHLLQDQFQQPFL